MKKMFQLLCNPLQDVFANSQTAQISVVEIICLYLYKMPSLCKASNVWLNIEEANSLVITVNDDGKKLLPETIAVEKVIKKMEQMTNEMGGTYKLQYKGQEGKTFLVTIPM